VKSEESLAADRVLCIFGGFDNSELYSRNSELVAAVSRCYKQSYRVGPASNYSETRALPKTFFSRVVLFALKSLNEFFWLARQRGQLGKASAYFVPYPAYLNLFFLSLLMGRKDRKKPILVDAFFCLHDTLVYDRRLLKPGGLLARLVRILERRTLSRSSLVFIDTEQQKRSLCNQYQQPLAKLVVTPVGIDESVWTSLPQARMSETFRVLFWGTCIPLHGIETIIRSAKLLEKTHPEICFQLIGDGQVADTMAELISQLNPTNLSWRRVLVSAAELREEVRRAHCILGIFASTEKAASVVPYKAYQALASNRILVTRRSPAFDEILQGVVPTGLFFVDAADSVALADCIAKARDQFVEIDTAIATREFYDLYLGRSVLRESVRRAVERL